MRALLVHAYCTLTHARAHAHTHGAGSVAGRMDFWDTYKKKLMGSWYAHGLSVCVTCCHRTTRGRPVRARRAPRQCCGVVCGAACRRGSTDRDSAKSFEWAPDDRSFVTATLHPWRRVANGFKVPPARLPRSPLLPPLFLFFFLLFRFLLSFSSLF